MPLDFDPIYHTETMVRILWDQGSTLHAMELAEKILEREPDNASVRAILDELKSEAKASFNRFRKVGKTEDVKKPVPEKAAPEEKPDPVLAEVEVLAEPIVASEPEPEAEKQAEAEPISLPVGKLDSRTRKAQVLEGLLTQVQNFRRQHD